MPLLKIFYCYISWFNSNFKVRRISALWTKLWRVLLDLGRAPLVSGVTCKATVGVSWRKSFLCLGIMTKCLRFKIIGGLYSFLWHLMNPLTFHTLHTDNSSGLWLQNRNYKIQKINMHLLHFTLLCTDSAQHCVIPLTAGVSHMRWITHVAQIPFSFYAKRLRKTACSDRTSQNWVCPKFMQRKALKMRVLSG